MGPGAVEGLPDLWAEIRGSGPLVVLLHGLADSHELWRHQIDPLSRKCTVAAVDHFGHGRSPLPSGELTTEKMADGVAALIERSMLGAATVVGLSMGGGVAQVLALRRPELVRGLVLVSTSSTFSPAARERHLGRVEIALREGMEPIADELVPRWFTGEYMRDHPDEVTKTRKIVLANQPAAFAAAARANAMRDWSDRLGEISCPVLYIGGEEDPSGARERAAVFLEHLPRLEVEIFPGSSHLVPVERPDEFNARLIRFLSRTVGPV